MTQFEPNHAREAFPCFDDPRFRSSFTIYIARLKKDGLSFSNMPIHDTFLPDNSVTGSNYVWDAFQSSTPMPTNLVSYAIVPNFSYVVTEGGNMRIVEKHTSNKIHYIYNQSPKIYRQLVRYTNTEHYLPKLDIVVVPFVANGKGGAGNWGMVNVEERFVIFNEDKCSAQQIQMALQLISSKFSHQWFGDLVTPAWYDNEWLKEGFGSYFGTFIAAKVETTFDLHQLFVVETIQESLWNEVTVQRAMTTPIRKPSQVTDVFDIISDKKAGSIIRMFELILSPDTFKKALHDFLQNGHDKQNGLVVEKNLLGAFDAVSSHETTKLPPHISTYNAMKTWTTNIGFPLITVTRNKAEGKVIVTQVNT
ncbi:glutamyl aminopeptidase-like isoform X2 [Planococcus citri]|uniref:glutamyl aminopeptidase-like isoform X2 n=1 Tax=Planococcus citri TaxID=170843 RepID=UPI0031F73072